jgi:hypothetical protein
LLPGYKLGKPSASPRCSTCGPQPRRFKKGSLVEFRFLSAGPSAFHSASREA